jgi:hypothetical protein
MTSAFTFARECTINQSKKQTSTQPLVCDIDRLAFHAKWQLEVDMAGRGNCLAVALIGLLLFLPANIAQAQAQAPSGTEQMQPPSPEALAAAKELVEIMHLNERFKILLPAIFQNLKPAIVQGRIEVGRKFDALVPMMMETFQQRAPEMVEAFTAVYARTFSVDELHAFIEFYKTPAGQKMLQKTPALSQELMTTGAKLGQSIGAEAEKRMIEELRKNGINP